MVVSRDNFPFREEKRLTYLAFTDDSYQGQEIKRCSSYKSCIATCDGGNFNVYTDGSTTWQNVYFGCV